LGLSAVPALPFLFDKPVEEAVEWVFHKGFETFGGKEAVGNAPATGRERILEKGSNGSNSKKEKEL
jgi:fission process protein 1